MAGTEYRSGLIVDMRLLFVVNSPAFFLSHRLPVALAARRSGYEVHVATAPGKAVTEIIGQGLVHHAIPISRSGIQPLGELNTFWNLWRLLGRVRPDILHLVTIKPVLYGGIAARFLRVPGVVAAISGLGTVFINDGVKVRLLRWLIKPLYRLALSQKNSRIIFQNPDDQAVVTRMGAVRSDRAVLIRGSGVDLSEYPVRPEPMGTPVVVFASRLLKDKGIREFVEAARLLRSRNVRVRFRVIGSPDPHNPASVTEQDIIAWRDEGMVEFLGYRTDIPQLFSQSNLVVLPSYYGEGLPKVLIEAAASGRAVITTNHPGCRDAIEPGKTGLLVPVRDADALADAIQHLVENPALRQKMGRAGRALAEREFSIEKVIAAHLEIYRQVTRREGA